jgi:hypothetical protein
MAEVDNATQLKQFVSTEERNRAEEMRFNTALEHHLSLDVELATEAKEKFDVQSMEELRKLYGTSNTEDGRAIAEFGTVVTAREQLLREIRVGYDALNNSSSRG